MARLTTVNWVNFTIGAATQPTTTQVGNLITHWYKLSYDYLYGPDTYSTDETTDASGLIDSDEFRAAMDAELSAVVQLWNEAGKSSNGEINPMPSTFLTTSFKKTLSLMLRRKQGGPYGNVRLWGEDWWDWRVPL